MDKPKGVGMIVDKKWLLSAFLVGCLHPLAVPSYAQDWQLVWQDEFESGLQPDEQKWSYQVGAGGWGNNELQYYTDRRTENARIEDGVLVIEARNESFGGAQYTSARLRSLGKGDWEYGRFEIRAKLPEGLGTWAAIWMMPSESAYGDGGWPDNGEIDIMEAVGHEPDKTHSAIHVNALNHHRGNNPFSTVTNATARSDFHVYALEWTPSRITTFVDDTPHLVYERGGNDWTYWPFDKPFHLLLNLAVGGDWGGLQGVDPSHYPARFEIDYVRVYEDVSGPPWINLEASGSREQLGNRLTYNPGDRIDLYAEAADRDTNITELTISQGDGVLASSVQSPVTFTINDALPGCYKVVATTVDGDGWEATSDTLHVHVGDACSQAPYLMTAPSLPGSFEAEHYDIGGSGISYLDVSQVNTGGAMRRSEAVDIGYASDIGGGYQIEDVTFREWTEYTVDVTVEGIYTMVARLAATKDGALTLSVNGDEWPEKLAYQSTNSTSFFRNATLDGIRLEKGLQTLRITHSTHGAYLNRYSFNLVSSTTVDRPSEEPVSFFSIYPNPFLDTFTIKLDRHLPQGGKVGLYDALGRRVFTKALRPLSRNDEVTLRPVTDLLPGLYFVILDDLETRHAMSILKR